MSIADNIKNEVLRLNEIYKMEADDKYDMWEEHVKFVLQEALCLARKYGANSEIVELGAMLHDISLIAKTGTRKDHHITSAEMAETILEKYQYPQDKIAKVKMCVLNHRSSKNLTDIECICVADADILAHFDNIPMLFNVILNDVWGNGSTNNIILPELRRRMKDSFEYDYNDLSERTKSSFSDRY